MNGGTDHNIKYYLTVSDTVRTLNMLDLHKVCDATFAQSAGMHVVLVLLIANALQP